MQDGRRHISSRRMKTLSECLGDDHDLTVLRSALLAEPERYGGEDRLTMPLMCIGQRQREFRSEAFRLGCRLYTESPMAYQWGLDGWWALWQEDCQQQH